MHIPDSMLHGQICPVTAAVSIIGLAAAAYFAFRSEKKPAVLKFAAVSALIFAGQMMNFSVTNGTSGHLLGGMLASALLGTPFGVLAISIIVTIQSLLFSDGGVAALGANILNMALIGAGVTGVLFDYISKKTSGKILGYINIVTLSWISIMFASFACSVELAISGAIDLYKVVPAMLGIHALIGIGEAIITLVLYFVFSLEHIADSPRWNIGLPIVLSALTALLFSPFASSFPDGLEWVAEKYKFIDQAAPAFVSPLTDYSVANLNNSFISTGLAGLIGVVVTFFAGCSIGAAMRLSFK